MRRPHDAFEEARKTAAQIERGSVWSKVELARLKAERELTEETDASGRNIFERYSWGDLAHDVITVGRSDRNARLIGLRGRSDLESQLAPELVGLAQQEAIGQAGPGHDENMYLRRLIELTEKQTSLMESQGRNQALSGYGNDS